MPRIRTIKPEFWTDEKMAKLSHTSRLLFLGLLNHADDEGRFRADPRIVKGVIFPLDDSMDSVSIHGALSELSVSKRIRLYKIDGELYGDIPKFKSHQKINRPTPSRIPQFTEDSVSPHGALSVGSGSGSGSGKGRGVKKAVVVAAGSKQQQRQQSNSSAFKFPKQLDNPVFWNLWDDWIAFRQTLKPRLLDKSFQMQLEHKLGALSEADAIKTIQTSMANGWKGLFPPKEKEKKKDEVGQSAAEVRALELSVGLIPWENMTEEERENARSESDLRPLAEEEHEDGEDFYDGEIEERADVHGVQEREKDSAKPA